MKKVMIIASTIFMLGGGISYVTYASSSSDPMPKATPKEQMEYETTNTYEPLSDEVYKTFEEYHTLVDIAGNHIENLQVIKDSQNKRKLLIADDQGFPQFKSIYIKKTNRLKVVDFDGGLIFNQVLGNDGEIATDDVVIEEKEEVKPTTKYKHVESEVSASESELSGVAEYNVLKSHINMGDYTSQMVEDNNHKRIILFKDHHENPQYKSIYVKKTDRLKIINLRGGLVYNQVINEELSDLNL